MQIMIFVLRQAGLYSLLMRYSRFQLQVKPTENNNKLGEGGCQNQFLVYFVKVTIKKMFNYKSGRWEITRGYKFFSLLDRTDNTLPYLQRNNGTNLEVFGFVRVKIVNQA